MISYVIFMEFMYSSSEMANVSGRFKPSSKQPAVNHINARHGVVCGPSMVVHSGGSTR